MNYITIHLFVAVL